MERLYVNDAREILGLSYDPYYDGWYWDDDGLWNDFLGQKEVDLNINFTQYIKD